MKFPIGSRVRYAPLGDDNVHEFCELGTVSSHRGNFVFVKFDRDLLVLGVDAQAKACDPATLSAIERPTISYYCGSCEMKRRVMRLFRMQPKPCNSCAKLAAQRQSEAR